MSAPINTNPRLTEGYQPDFDIDGEVGRQGELWVADIVKALREGRAEVKTDQMAAITQRLYVEDACRRRDGWQPSGIAETKSDVWVFVLAVNKLALVLSTEFLRSLYLGKGGHANCDRGSHPTRGRIIPIGNVVMEALRHD